MISSRLRIAVLMAVLVYFLIVFYLLKRKTLHLKYTLLWLTAGLAMFALAVWPQILLTLTSLVGIYDPTNALFVAALFFVIMILMSLTAIVSKLNDKNKRLIQTIALLEKRIRELEEMQESEVLQDDKCDSKCQSGYNATAGVKVVSHLQKSVRY